ncbi:MAG: penicillin-binding protein 2 [Thermodesulfobacteriota bacterium]
MANYLKAIDSEWFKPRLSMSVLIVAVVFTVILVRLFYLQIVEGESYRALSENNSIRVQEIVAQRGLIFDKRGELLVENRPSFDLVMIPKDAKPVDVTLGKLSRYLNLPEEELRARVENSKGKPAFKPVVLKQDINRDLVAAVEVNQYDLPGVFIDVSIRRQYMGRLGACHLIGYLGEVDPEELKKGKLLGIKQGDMVGKSGVEKTYDPILRGERGGRQVEVNASGQIRRVLNKIDPVPGYNLVLTIDYRVQKQAELALSDVTGAAVALDPQNGNILAIASSPAFDQNMFVVGLTRDQWKALISNPSHPMTNKAVQGEYPPASTYKIITAIAGLEEGVINENTMFYCPGHYVFGKRVYRCWKNEGHGYLAVEDAIAQSCDVFFYQVGQRLGVDRIAKYAMKFGLGSSTGVELDHESRGLIPTSEWKKKRFGVPWQSGETLSIAIGQGYNVTTPIQLAVMIAAVANEGIRYKPKFIKGIETPEGKIIDQPKAEILERFSLNKHNLEIVKAGLWKVVNSQRGTAWRSKIEGIDMCGKTGTAQVVGRKKGEAERSEKTRPAHYRPHAWFVAYAPAQDPKIAVAVIVEHGEHGSSAAAPIAKEMIKTYLLEPEEGSSLINADIKNDRISEEKKDNV